MLINSVTLSVNQKVTVKRIAVGKYGTCAGQACIAIDYVLVENGYCSKLVHPLTKIAVIMFITVFHDYCVS